VLTEREVVEFAAQPDEERWAARLEIYETDPDPDLSKWTTQLLFRLSD
jgi:hypothetical protein